MSLTQEQTNRVQVVDRRASHRSIGLSFRHAKDGPELDLINWFLDQRLVSLPRGHRLTVFREPRLPSGFPDLVLVIWKESIAKQWTEERAGLTHVHLRLMHYLATEGPTSVDHLSSIFCTTVDAPLERLEQASMIRLAKGRWRANSLATTFAATRIVAIEAKIAEWKAALDQAHINTWFASESCVLVPRVPRHSALLHHAQERGVTVLAKEGNELQQWAPSFSGPRSYVSWLFNEWAWRAAYSSEG